MDFIKSLNNNNLRWDDEQGGQIWCYIWRAEDILTQDRSTVAWLDLLDRIDEPPEAIDLLKKIITLAVRNDNQEKTDYEKLWFGTGPSILLTPTDIKFIMDFAIFGVEQSVDDNECGMKNGRLMLSEREMEIFFNTFEAKIHSEYYRNFEIPLTRSEWEHILTMYKEYQREGETYEAGILGFFGDEDIKVSEKDSIIYGSISNAKNLLESSGKMSAFVNRLDEPSEVKNILKDAKSEMAVSFRVSRNMVEMYCVISSNSADLHKEVPLSRDEREYASILLETLAKEERARKRDDKNRYKGE